MLHLCYNFFGRLQSFRLLSVCREGGAGDCLQGHHRKGIPDQSRRQQAGSKPFHQAHRPGAGGVPQGGGAETEGA